MNSCDINGDLMINLVDVAFFTVDIGTATYRSDFNWDGSVNLSDVARFTTCIGASCP
jgi:hypothetical protein